MLKCETQHALQLLLTRVVEFMGLGERMSFAVRDFSHIRRWGCWRISCEPRTCPSAVVWHQQVTAGDAGGWVHDHVHLRWVQAAGGHAIEVLGAKRQAAVVAREGRGGLGGADGGPGVGGKSRGSLGWVLEVWGSRLSWKGTATVLALDVVLAAFATFPTHREVLVRLKDRLVEEIERETEETKKTKNSLSPKLSEDDIILSNIFICRDVNYLIYQFNISDFTWICKEFIKGNKDIQPVRTLPFH